jgi:hypothetical protein
MRCFSPLSAISILGLVACNTNPGPVNRGSFDPLRPPGSNRNSGTNTPPAFTAGQFVRASMDNTAFFKARPNGNADADKLLKRDTSMKVISNGDSYVKVELDNGEVGFVPSVMLLDPNSAGPTSGIPGEYQPYPPLPADPNGGPLPIIDPAGLPPEGAIPAVIDPDAPATSVPAPPPTPIKDQFAAPLPKAESGEKPTPETQKATPKTPVE